MNLSFTLPLLPPSVNHYKVRRYFSNRETQAFMDAVCIFSKKQPVTGRFFIVDITYYLPDAELLRWDTNNFAKVAIDALVKAGVIRDDRYILEERARKRPSLGLANAWERATHYAIQGLELAPW